MLRGRDILRYEYRHPKSYILLTKNGINVPHEYPAICRHLEVYGDDFKNRGAQGRHWANLRACAFLDDFKQQKIVWIELSNMGRFALCTNEVYLLNSAYFMLPPVGIDPLFLLGILNSRVIRFYMTMIADTSGMGTIRWINNHVKRFPIPSCTYTVSRQLSDLVGKILAEKKALSEADTSSLEKQVDNHVYSL